MPIQSDNPAVDLSPSTGTTLNNIVVGNFVGNGTEDYTSGQDDIAGWNGSQWLVYAPTLSYTSESIATWGFSTVSSATSETVSGTPSTWQQAYVADFNGNGREDIAAMDASGNWWIATSTGSGFELSQWTTLSWGLPSSTEINPANPTSETAPLINHIVIGDFNGDGRSDIVEYTNEGWLALISNGTSFTTITSTTTPSAFPSLASPGSWTFGVGDFEDNGRDELVAYNVTTNNVFISQFNGSSFDEETSWFAGSIPMSGWTVAQMAVGDFTGDGMAGILLSLQSTSNPENFTWDFLQSTGTSLANTFPTYATLVAAYNQPIRVMDYEGNGADDAVFEGGNGTWEYITATIANNSVSLSKGLQGILSSTLSLAPAGNNVIFGNFLNEAQGAAQAFENVYNSVAFQAYPGAIKDPQATQESGGGNDWDQAGDLISQLEAMGISAEYAYGTISLPVATVENWLGTDESGAQSVLTAMGEYTTSTAAYVTFFHAWVSATLPGFNGITNYNLDPSIKPLQYENPTTTAFELNSSLTAYVSATEITNLGEGPTVYDDSGDNPANADDLESLYLSNLQYQNELPEAFYESKLAAYLAQNDAGQAITDYEFTDQPVAEQFSAATDQLYLDPSYLEGFDTLSTVPTGYAESVTFKLTGWDSSTEASNGTTYFNTMMSMPTIDAAQIAVDYAANYEAGNAPSYAVAFVPQLYINGSQVTTDTQTLAPASATSIELASDSVALVVTVNYPGEIAAASYTFVRTAGQPIAIGLGAQQFSPQFEGGLEEQLATLAQAANNTSNDSNPAWEGYQQLVLYTAETDFLQQVLSQDDQIAAFGDDIPVLAHVNVGVMTGEPILDPSMSNEKLGASIWAYQHPIFSYNTTTDNPGIAVDYETRVESDLSGLNLANVVQLSQDNGSASEDQILQQMFNVDAVSTINGIQWTNTEVETDAFSAPTPVEIPSSDFSAHSTFTSASLSEFETTLLPQIYTEDGSSSSVFESEVLPLFNELTNVPTNETADVFILDQKVEVNDPSDNDWNGLVWIARYDLGIVPQSIIYGIQQDNGESLDGGSPTGFVPSALPDVPPSISAQTTGDSDPVNLASGSVEYEAQDIDLPNAGIPLTFTRYYNSSDALNANLGVDDQGFGPGWSYSFGGYLEITNTVGGSQFFDQGATVPVVALFTDDGEEETFTLGNRTSFSIGTSDYIFEPPPGVPENIELIGGVFNGTALTAGTFFLASTVDGMASVFQIYDQTDGATNLAYARLTQVEDHSGNAVSVTYGVSDSRQISVIAPAHEYLSLVFEYTDSLISSIIVGGGDIGQTWSYTEDDGMLSQVTSPSGSQDSGYLADQLITDYAYVDITTLRDDSFTDFLLDLVSDPTSPNGASTAHSFSYYPDGRVLATEDTYIGPSTPVEYFFYNTFNYGSVAQQYGQTPSLNQNSETTHDDFNGNETKYVFDSQGEVTDQINPDGTQELSTYDSDDDLIEYIDELGRPQLYTWQDNNLPLRHDDAADSYTYGSDGPVYASGPYEAYTYQTESTPSIANGQYLVETSEVNATGEQWKYYYDSYGNVALTVDPLGDMTVTLYQYSGGFNGLPEQTWSANQVSPTSTSTYSTPESVASFGTVYVDAFSTSITYDYGLVSTVTTVMSATATETTEYGYDNAGNLTQVQNDSNVTGEGAETQYNVNTLGEVNGTTVGTLTTDYYYVDGLKVAIADSPGSNTTTYIYDVEKRLAETIEPDGTFTRNVYDPMGDAVETFNALGNATLAVLDWDGRTIEAVNPDGSTNLSVYDSGGRVVESVDGNGNTTTTTYNSANQPTVVVLPNGDSTVNQYDFASGNLTLTKQYSGSIAYSQTEYGYDHLNRIVLTVVPDATQPGSVTGVAYDENGNATSTTEYAYQSGYSLTSVFNNTPPSASMAEITTTEYDVLNRPIEMQDANEASDTSFGQTYNYSYTTWYYNADSQVLGDIVASTGDGSTDPFSTSTGIMYEATGYSYNGSGQLQSKIDPPTESLSTSGTPLMITPTVSYFYNNDNQLEEVIGPSLDQSVVYSYDRLGRQVEVQTSTGDTSPSPSVITTYTVYNAAGEAVVTIDGDRNDTFYRYDPMGRLTYQQQPEGTTGIPSTAPATTTTYNADGDVISTVDPRSITAEYFYDALNRQTDALANVQSGYIDVTGTTSYNYSTFTTAVLTVIDPNQGYVYGERFGLLIPGLSGLQRATIESVTNEGTSVIYDLTFDGILTSFTNPEQVTFGVDTQTIYGHNVVAINTSTPSGGQPASFNSGSMATGILTIDAMGIPTVIYYDARGLEISQAIYNPTPQVPSITATFVTISSSYYDSFGNEVEEVNALSETTTYKYDFDNRVVKSVDPLSYTAYYTYDGADNLLTSIAPTSSTLTEQMTTNEYDAENQLISQSPPSPTSYGQSASYATLYYYDAAGNQTNVVDPTGARTETVYDFLGHATSIFQASDDSGDVVAVPDEYFYDADGNLIETAVPTTTINGTTIYNYDTTTYVYDNLDRLIQESTTGPWDESTSIFSAWASTNANTTSYYTGVADGADGVDSNLASGTIEAAYTLIGDLTLEGVVNGQDSYILNSNFGKISSSGTEVGDFSIQGVINANDFTLLAGNFGRASSVTNESLLIEYGPSYDPMQAILQYAEALDYAAGELNAPPSPSGQQITAYYSYDNDGNLTQEIDQDRRTTSYSYDAFNEPTLETWYSNKGVVVGGVSAAYDGDGRVISYVETDAPSTTTNYTYDVFAYDNLGDTISEFAFTGDVGTYSAEAYNNECQLSLQSNFTGVTMTPQLSLTSNGLLLAATQAPSLANVKATFDDLEVVSYDNDDRVSTEEIANWGMLESSLSSLSGWATYIPYPGHVGGLGINEASIVTPLVVSMTYNSVSQLSTITRASGYNIASTNPTQVSGPSTTYSYDSAGRLSAEADAEGATTLVSYSYSSYDNDDRLLTETFSDGSGSTITSTFAYTATGEVNTENDSGEYDGSAYSPNSYTNTYDLNGNLTGTGISNGPNNQVDTEGSVSYLYDPDGNRLVAYASPSDYNDYITDNRDRLTNVIAPTATQSVNYTYNALNQRVEEQDVNGATTTYTQFDYDPDGNPVMQYNSGGMTDLYLPDATGGVAPLAHEDSSGNVTWLLTDQNGSVQDVANANGTSLTYRVLYNAFGQTLEPGSGTPSVFGYQGMMQSTTAPSGIFPLYYDNARWYDPATENFISQDPKGLVGGDTNLYRFAGNDPVNNNDPTGMDTGVALGPSAEDVSGDDDDDDPFELASSEEYGPPAPVASPAAPQSGITLNDWAASLSAPATSPVASPSLNLTPADLAAVNAAMGPFQLPADAQHVGPPDPVIESDSQIQADAAQAQQNLESQTAAYVSELEQQKLGIESQIAQAQQAVDYWTSQVAQNSLQAEAEQSEALLAAPGIFQYKAWQKTGAYGIEQAIGYAAGESPDDVDDTLHAIAPVVKAGIGLVTAFAGGEIGALEEGDALFNEGGSLEGAPSTEYPAGLVGDNLSNTGLGEVDGEGVGNGFDFNAAENEDALVTRAGEVQGALDPIAQNMRTTAALSTEEGTTIIGGGVRDLTPAQRAILGPGEMGAALSGEHAEITVLQAAADNGLTPQALGVTRSICPDCQAAIEASGGTLTSPTTAVFPEDGQ